jgi:hypothetical protein
MYELARSLSHWIETSSLSIFLQNLKNEVPITQSIHLLGICLIVGSSAMIDLRLLGLLNQDQPVTATMRRFIPALWTGVAVAAASGFVMVLTEPSRSLPAVQFQFKMVVLVFVVGFTIWLQRRAVANGDDGPVELSVQAVAAASLGMWAVMIAAGRWIAYA